jgi:hypothetical protein
MGKQMQGSKQTLYATIWSPQPHREGFSIHLLPTLVFSPFVIGKSWGEVEPTDRIARVANASTSRWK